MEKTIHHGRNVKRFREMLGIKQGAFAADMGDDWSQDKISRLEQKEEIDDTLLEQIAGLLKVPVEAIKNFDEEAAVNIISSTFDNGSIGFQKNEQCTFNPIDKVMELFERLLASEKEKVDLMKEILGKMKG
jgi:transcriptional regulator with XRE-family HTH domain